MKPTVLVFFAMLFPGWLAAGETGSTVPVKVTMRPVTSFGYLDVNNDARITPSEAKADWAVAQGFARADANGDGFLDREEFAILQKF